MNQALFSSLICPSLSLQACVIIPARDESEGIEATLDSFANQRSVTGEPLDTASFEILLLANNCRDETAHIARRWSERHPCVTIHILEADFYGADACVGYVRRLLMDVACQRLMMSGQQELLNEGKGKRRKPRAICSTDADTQVSPFWISHTLEEMNAGALAVGGRIFVQSEVGDPSRRTYLLDTAYRLLCARLESKLDPNAGDPFARHFQFFGASLAICPELYVQIGGLPKVNCLEDMALERALNLRDIEVRHSPYVTVRTSARRTGRVETGLSTQLREWSELGQQNTEWLVPSGEEIAFKARLRRRMRRYWSTPDDKDECEELAANLLLCPNELEAHVKAAPYFGALWEQLWQQAWENPAFRSLLAPVPVEVALSQLRQMLEGVREK